MRNLRGGLEVSVRPVRHPILVHAEHGDDDADVNDASVLDDDDVNDASVLEGCTKA